MTQDPKTLVDTMMDAQKGLVDTMVENTKRLSAGNPAISETVEKGTEWYKNWLEGQKALFGQTTQKATEATEAVKDTAAKAKETYQNWMDHSTAWGRQFYDMNLNMMKASMPNQQAPANPMEAASQAWNNAMSQWQNMMSGANSMNSWMRNMQNMQSMNPFTNDSWKNAGSQFNGIFNQWYEMLNSSVANLQNNFQSSSVQDAYRNMVNSADGFARFYQMWAPMWKSIQDKNFNMDMYRQFMNPAQYKDMMDQYFGFMPEHMRSYMQQSTSLMQDAMKQMGSTGANGFAQARQMMGSFMPAPHDMFASMLNNYNSMQSAFENAASPIARMQTPNQYTKNMMEWQDIANRMAQWSIKNAELQYLVYQQGSVVMDQLAENVMNKMQHGEEVSSMMALYQEWMGMSDKTFVQLFESESYSQLMAEVSSMQMRLKKDIELQLEKSMSGLPVATRSELDELYKTIYDLKKQVRQMEKMLEVDGNNEAPAEAPAAEAITKTRTNKK
jgi:hypothetical protein